MTDQRARTVSPSYLHRRCSDTSNATVDGVWRLSNAVGPKGTTPPRTALDIAAQTLHQASRRAARARELVSAFVAVSVIDAVRQRQRQRQRQRPPPLSHECGGSLRDSGPHRGRPR
jgi:hypothetical protein